MNPEQPCCTMTVTFTEANSAEPQNICQGTYARACLAFGLVNWIPPLMTAKNVGHSLWQRDVTGVVSAELDHTDIQNPWLSSKAKL